MRVLDTTLIQIERRQRIMEELEQILEKYGWTMEYVATHSMFITQRWVYNKIRKKYHGYHYLVVKQGRKVVSNTYIGKNVPREIIIKVLDFKYAKILISKIKRSKKVRKETKERKVRKVR